MVNQYAYLFPFESVPAGAKVVIYGAGEVGLSYLRQLLMTCYAEPVAVADQKWKQYPPLVVPYCPPDKINELKFDYVVLAMKSPAHVEEIISKLVPQGIPADKIIYQSPRVEQEVYGDLQQKQYRASPLYAFEMPGLPIALKMGPGLGDAIQRRLVVDQLAEALPGCKIDIYAPAPAIIKSLYADIAQINAIIEDAGGMYAKDAHLYVLSMQVYYVLLIDEYKEEALRDLPSDLRDKINRMVGRCRAYDLQPFPKTRVRIHIERTMLCGGSCYNLFDYTGFFHDNGKKVPIPMLQTYRTEYERMGLGRYLTIHTGSRIAAQGHQEYDARQWPWHYYSALVQLLKTRYPDMRIVQIGDSATKALPDADRLIFNADLELIKYILQGSVLHISTEGGLMHLATQLGTKCLTLFGQTQVEMFGYEQNINVVSAKCHGCYCLYDNPFVCARGMKRPECMEKLVPELVMEHAAAYLDPIYADG